MVPHRPALRAASSSESVQLDGNHCGGRGIRAISSGGRPQAAPALDGQERSRTFRAVQVGTGGHGADWCRRILPPFLAAGRLEIVAAVDIDAAALANAERHLGLPCGRCYTDLRRALDENPADFCIVVVPPSAHEQVVDEAIRHDLHVLCEKPLADSLAACVRIVTNVTAAGVRMGVTMSHRFDQDKTSLRARLRSGRHGPLDYLVYRFTCDFRRFPAFGRTQHRMLDPLMIDAAVHHLDIIADLVDGRCQTVYAQTWNPSWGDFDGDSQALVLLSFDNGTRALYEGALSNAVGSNCWADEYIRAECRDATLVLNHRRLEMLPHAAAGREGRPREGQGVELPMLQRPTWQHAWLIEQFLGWLDGGPPMPTAVADNLESIAVVFAAIESSRSGEPVRVGALLEAARRGAPQASELDESRERKGA